MDYHPFVSITAIGISETSSRQFRICLNNRNTRCRFFLLFIRKCFNFAKFYGVIPETQILDGSVFGPALRRGGMNLKPHMGPDGSDTPQ